MRENEIEGSVAVGQLHFLSDDQLVVTFTSHVIAEALPRRDRPDISSNISLCALFVDTRRGQLVAKREWPTFSERSRITPVRGGEFLVITPDKLMLYSPEARLLKELSLPVAREGLETDWNALPSPAGKYLEVRYYPRDDKDLPRTSLGKWEVIDTDALRVVWAGADPGNGGIHVGRPLEDGSVLAYNGTGGGLLVGRPGGPWQPLPLQPDARGWIVEPGAAALGTAVPNSAAPLDRGCRLHDGIPINDHVLFSWNRAGVDRECCGLALTTGEVIFRQIFADKEVVRWLARSAGGHRFALAIDRGKGGSRVLDMPAHYSLNRIVVYDIPSRRWVFTLSGKQQGIRSISGLALSPDGQLMALIDESGVLSLYRLPDCAPTFDPTAGRAASDP